MKRISISLLMCCVVFALFSCSSGVKNGLIKSEGKTYYYENDVMKSGWQKIGKDDYYFDDNGVMVISDWIKYGNDWYYLDSSGKMCKNRFVDDYYVGVDGKMQKNTNVTIDGKEYCFGANGKIKSEFEYISDEYREYYDGIIAKFAQYNTFTKGAHRPIYQNCSSDAVFDALDSSRFGGYDYINYQDKPIEMEVYYIKLWDAGFIFTSPKNKNNYSLRAVLDNQVRYNDSSAFLNYPGSVKGENKKTEYLAKKVKLLKNGDKIKLQGFLMWTPLYNEWLLYTDDFMIIE